MNTEEEVNKATNDFAEKKWGDYRENGFDKQFNNCVKDFKAGYELGQQSQSADVADDDPDEKYLPGRLNFYREQMKKLRTYLNENNIGKPNQNFFDAMYEHIQDLKQKATFSQFALESIAENERIHQQIENVEVGDKEIEAHPLQNISEVGKEEIINKAIEESGKIMLFTYVSLGLKEGITGSVVNQATDDLFELSFKRADTGKVINKDFFFSSDKDEEIKRLRRTLDAAYSLLSCLPTNNGNVYLGGFDASLEDWQRMNYKPLEP